MGRRIWVNHGGSSWKNAQEFFYLEKCLFFFLFYHILLIKADMEIHKKMIKWKIANFVLLFYQILLVKASE